MHDDGTMLALLSETASPKPILFIGAGVSCEVGFPSWTQLMREIVALGLERQRLRNGDVKVVESLLKSGDYLAAGEVLRGKLGRLVDDFLRRRFATLPPHFGSYEYLVRLPYAGIITTNYDACIETAYAKHFGSPLLTLHLEEPEHIGAIGRGEPFLLKLHGDARRGTAVISASDYSVIEHNQPLQAALSSLFLTHPVAFLGYGMSDNDILTPLGKLRSTYTGAAAQKIALLPETISGRERTRLEEDFRVDVETYDPAHGHRQVGATIREAFLRHEAAEGRDAARSGADFTEVFTFAPPLFHERLAKRADADLAFLDASSSRWGPFLGSDARAANIAEMLLAISTSRAYADHQVPASDPIRDLLAMMDGGRVKSLSLTVSNLQTQALALLALAAWSELDADARTGLRVAAEWLLANARPDGWPRFDGDDPVCVVTTLSALTALTVAGLDAEPIWAAFRGRLAVQLRGDSDGDQGMAPVIAGWTLILLHQRSTRFTPDAPDLALRDQAVDVLTDPTISFDDVAEPLPYTEASGAVGWRTWRHPTASIAVLGLAPWLSDHPVPTVRAALGRCFAQLLMMRTPENSAEKFLFPMMYRVMAIARYRTFETGWLSA